MIPGITVSASGDWTLVILTVLARLLPDKLHTFDYIPQATFLLFIQLHDGGGLVSFIWFAFLRIFWLCWLHALMVAESTLKVQPNLLPYITDEVAFCEKLLLLVGFPYKNRQT